MIEVLKDALILFQCTTNRNWVEYKVEVRKGVKDRIKDFFWPEHLNNGVDIYCRKPTERRYLWTG